MKYILNLCLAIIYDKAIPALDALQAFPHSDYRSLTKLQKRPFQATLDNISLIYFCFAENFSGI